MADPHDLLGAFHFEVLIPPAGARGGGAAADAGFQEVSGLEAEMEFEEVREGGENRFVHRLPKRGKHPNLVLKRGLVRSSSPLANWAAQTIGSNLTKPIVPRLVMVRLLNLSGNPAVYWTFYAAYPVKWVAGPLNSTGNNLMVETIELSYNYCERSVTGL